MPKLYEYFGLIILFYQFIVADGDLLWHDYDLCFPIIDLYEGRL